MLRVPEHVRKTNCPEGGIVLDLKRGRLFTLDPVAARILDLLDCHDSALEIAKALTCESGVSLEVTKNDVAEFLVQLERHQLVEARPFENPGTRREKESP